MQLRKRARRGDGVASACFGLESLENRQHLDAGLTGSYFLDDEFNLPLGTQVDPGVQLNWTGASSGTFQLIPGSVRWTGQLTPKFSEYYTFHTESLGGVRLWVNGKLLIDDGDNIGASQHSAKLREKLLAGQSYSLQVEYIAPEEAGTIALKYSSTRTPLQVVPTERLRSEALANRTIRINFTDSSAPNVTGYYPDNGAVFQTHRRSGLTYGWDVSNDRFDFARNSPRSFSSRYDGGAQMQPKGMNRTWSIAVPNGTYKVRVVMGDANLTSGFYSVDVDGKAAVRGQVSSDSRWYDGTVTVTVTDGKIQLTNGDGAQLNRISFVEITPMVDMDRYVFDFPIGFSTSNAATRHVSQGMLAGGWEGFINRFIQPGLDRGYRRIILHNPFGVSADGTMQLDQYIEAQRAGLTWLTDDFVSAWKPITDSGIEVTAYIGHPYGDADFGSTYAEFDAHLWASLSPFVQAGMGVAFDYSINQPESGPLYAAAQKLRSMDLPVYVEARPTKQEPWWRNFGFVCGENFWERSNPELYSDSAVWALRNDELTGDVLRWIHEPPAGYDWTTIDWLLPIAQKILNEGYTAMLPGYSDFWQIDLGAMIAKSNGYLG